MTVHVIARPSGVGTDFAAGNYNISYDVAYTDGTSDQSAGVLVQVSLLASVALINLQIPTQIAAYVSAQLGVTVLPSSVIFTPYA